MSLDAWLPQPALCLSALSLLLSLGKCHPNPLHGTAPRRGEAPSPHLGPEKPLWARSSGEMLCCRDGVEMP